MKYEEYQVWDFIEDDYFVSWAKGQDQQADKFWTKWLAQHPHKSEQVQLARHIINNIRYELDEQPTERQRVDMFENIVKGRQQTQYTMTPPKARPLRLIMRYAAILIGVGFGIGLWALLTDTVDPKVAQSVPMVKKRSPSGMKSTLWLNDGTKVVLNASTSLYYPEYFSDTSRIVYLRGEAFFEVEKDPKRPFTVVSRGIHTQVLGTAFNVRSYHDESTVSVGVVEGKVKVFGAEMSDYAFEHTLRPMEMSRIDLKTKQAEKGAFVPSESVAWKDWELIFKNQNLESIFKELERWYAVEIIAPRGMNMKHLYSGRFDNEPLKAVLEVLAHNADFNYKIEGKRVKIIN